MKKIAIAIILILCVATCAMLSACSGKYRYEPLDATVRYLTNVAGETITLSSGREVISENVVYHSESVKTGDVLTPPEIAPKRVGYDFAGWAEDKAGTKLYDFTQPVTGSLNLYAKWDRSADAETALEYTEPTLSFVEKIDESSAFTLTGVCNQPISGGSVDLTTAGINRLTAKATDVREYLNYTRASATTIDSAVYQAGQVKVTFTAYGSQNEVSVNVNNVTSSYNFTDSSATSGIDEGTFETKARRYESTDYASYKVILAGSSSMENWSESGYDMAPVTTKNVGIGGSATEHWNNGLAQRLIIPYNPRAVVFYLGINDIINYGKSAAATTTGLQNLFTYIHERLPETAIYFILINHVPGYTQHKTKITTTNNNMKAFAAENDYVNIIDAGSVLEKASGNYSEAYFLKDGLHMSLCGYQLWGAVVKNTFIAREKEIYGND